MAELAFLVALVMMEPMDYLAPPDPVAFLVSWAFRVPKETRARTGQAGSVEQQAHLAILVLVVKKENAAPEDLMALVDSKERGGIQAHREQVDHRGLWVHLGYKVNKVPAVKRARPAVLGDLGLLALAVIGDSQDRQDLKGFPERWASAEEMEGREKTELRVCKALQVLMVRPGRLDYRACQEKTARMAYQVPEGLGETQGPRVPTASRVRMARMAD